MTAVPFKYNSRRLAIPLSFSSPPSVIAVLFMSLDQRENRRQVESLARGRDVLNAFSFSGGFSLYAARGGARSVTDLDLSAHALAGAKRNFALNATNASVASCRHELVQADAFVWLKSTSRGAGLIW